MHFSFERAKGFVSEDKIHDIPSLSQFPGAYNVLSDLKINTKSLESVTTVDTTLIKAVYVKNRPQFEKQVAY